MRVDIYSMVDDDKTQYLKEFGIKHNVHISTSPYKPVFFPLVLLISIMRLKKPNAIIVRYMNDNKYLFFSLILFFSRIFTFILADLFSIKIIWFCHNVDKESIEHYPFLTNLKRKYLVKRAAVIYVMDKLLVPVAKRQFPEHKEKIDYISFGVRDTNFRRKANITCNKLINTLREISRGDCLVGFCPTNAGEKYLHIEYASKLVNAAQAEGIKIFIILLGDLKKYFEDNEKIKKEISNNANVIVFDQFIDYDASELSQYISFYWRGLNDQSISYSLYEAATQKKPVLALDVGFIGKAVKEYKLGEVIGLDFSNSADRIQNLAEWDADNASQFLREHSWENSIQKIKKTFE